MRERTDTHFRHESLLKGKFLLASVHEGGELRDTNERCIVSERDQ